MADWTLEQVAARFAEAADVLAPADMRPEFSDLVGQTPEPMRRPPPSPSAISQMEETITWSHFLKPEDPKLVSARAEGAPWKAILLAVRHRPRHRAPALAVRALPNRVAAQWSKSSGEAVVQLRRRTCEGAFDWR